MLYRKVLPFQQIQRWKLEGRSNREIARLLGKV
ncbi:helix-turn-helix domain-containing protein, partial [Streptococcus dysgalactiae]